MAESEEKLKSLLMKVKQESEKVLLKTQHSENYDHGIRSYHFTENRWGKMETVIDFLFLSSTFTADGDCNQMKRYSLERKLKQT